MLGKRTPALMLQGTGSDVGKSLLSAGLCRLFARQGLIVRPFKPQNMSNNAAVTQDGGEIGRAQALQARACFTPPMADMNPVLLKPHSDTGAQVVVQGKVEGVAGARDYHKLKRSLLPRVLDSYHRLAAQADVMVIEGAGSAAEVNLRESDIANMGFAEAADVPVILVADIDRGGVIAAIVGTWELLPANERARLKGYIINRFRGDPALFRPALDIIAARTGLPCLGIIPWFAEAARLPAEDAASLGGGSTGTGSIHIAIPRLSRIANFDDFDPLAAEPNVRLTMVPPGQALPGDAHLIILPGSKSTIGDLAFLRSQGWDMDIHAHVRRGGRVLGICAGYQMLGHTIADPLGVEGPVGGQAPGLGLLDVATIMEGDKVLRAVSGSDNAGHPVHGYEMHMGRTTGPHTARPMLMLERQASNLTHDAPSRHCGGGQGRERARPARADIKLNHPDGAISDNGQIMGCYLHGLFAADGWRHALLASLGGNGTGIGYETMVEDVLDRLAKHLEMHLDMEALGEIAKQPPITSPPPAPHQ